MRAPAGPAARQGQRRRPRSRRLTWRARAGGTALALAALSGLAVSPPAAASGRSAHKVARLVRPLWGIDTLSTMTPTFLAAVDTDAGVPQFAGRYLVYGQGMDLSAAESARLHSLHIAILLLVAPANQSLRSGAVALNEAATAVADAQVLGVPKGTAIFRDVERTDAVSANYLWAWSSLVASAGYVPGFYADPRIGRRGFGHAFCRAEQAHPQLGSMVAVYASEPRFHTDRFDRTAQPPWAPGTAACPMHTVAWQYREDDQNPNIDVDEFLVADRSLLW